ncbi:tetracycline resistance MFS efflux pump [Nitrospira sp. KM1]|uniref:TCR/Tet family MFS transporter n=1 Tax=Nitrospira sp. KM1 TaxID=1936990 RepID=UPI0013A759A0|nr:TCR/Tet family MFS transporter [Nitrospira sp. KM1]BCA52921.1 tetracycline resistance MFS efflux pump [Nitrospira sp. KM1]
MNNPLPTPTPRRAAVFFIFVTIMLDMLSFGIIIPVLPTLVEEFTSGDTRQAAEIYGLMGTAWAIMQFICSPIQGALSDRFGRRPIILLSNVGLGIDYMVMALAPNLAWLFAGRVISGIASSSFSTAGAYIADVTSVNDRAAAFGKIGVAFGLGFVLGPAIGGLLGASDPRLPFWGAGITSLLNACYGYFVLPESLAPEKRMPFSWKRANPVGSLILLRSHHELFGLATANFLTSLAHVVLPSVTVLYLGYRYGWGATTVGLTMAAVGVGAMIVQGALVKPITARLGERRALAVGLLCGAVGFCIYGFAPNGFVYCFGIPVMAFWGLTGPSAQSLMTRHVSHQEQGQLQGAIGSLMGIAGLIGPTIFTQTFARFIAPESEWQLPGAPFLLASMLLLAAMAIAWRATRPRAM